MEFAISVTDIEAAFANFGPKTANADPLTKSNGTLAKFALLRWDELAELAMRLADITRKSKVDKNTFSVALSRLRDGRWRTNREYVNYLRDQEYERRDCSMLNVWMVEGIADNELCGRIRATPGGRAYTTALTDASKIRFAGYVVRSLGNGRLQLARK